MIKDLNICVDIDGTVTDPYGFIPYLNEIFGVALTKEEYTTLDWGNLYGFEHDDFYRNFDRDYAFTYEKAEKMEKSSDVVNRLSAENNIYFVTARQNYLYEITDEWLLKNGFRNYELYTLGYVKKSGKAKELKCDIFIEDDPDNALDLSENGINVILIDTNYNKYVHGDRIRRIRCWDEVESAIESFL